MAYGKDAPFDRDKLDEYTTGGLLEWLVSNVKSLTVNVAGKPNHYPIGLWFRGSNITAGEINEKFSREHAHAVACKVYDIMYPPVSEKKRLSDMSIPELREEAKKLCRWGVGVWHTTEPGLTPYYARCNNGTAFSNDQRSAMVDAIRNEAQRVGRYDPVTDTIKEE